MGHQYDQTSKLARLKLRKYFKEDESEEFAENPIISNAININAVKYFKIIGKNDFSIILFNNLIILINRFYSCNNTKEG